MADTVKFWREQVVIPTYMPDLPDKHPMFLEKRVYQGSSGVIYPLPFTDRISETKIDREWQAIFIENPYLTVMILPEIGGRIHAIYDRSNDYDLIYRQTVIKPALVGLAGSWISGGIEFNWPQHHRPGTFLPVSVAFEEHDDGSKTVWLGDHEPMSRMKGMHGVCLGPDTAYVELKARVTNRTQLRQTFLWWANVATKVHEGYQSFFPTDVTTIADHAKRALSSYPHCSGHYYGVNYAERALSGVPTDEVPAKFVPPHCGQPDPRIPDYSPDDLSWYANIPVPTSYMCVGSNEDFFGGYDHWADAGIVHIADHHISPGKKQWTWGNHDFGYSWNRNLSDDEAPYIELMAGVFTDNQPDFSFLEPWETRSWSQYWYGIGKIGVPRKANLDVAISVTEGKTIRVGVSVTRVFEDAKLCVELDGRTLEWTVDISPDAPLLVELANDESVSIDDLRATVYDKNGRELIAYQPSNTETSATIQPATEPLLPAEISNVEELFLIGSHLDQYRHATRVPEIYWLEGVQRDPLDSRCNNALGLLSLRRGEFSAAVERFENAIERLTKLNPNPPTGEPFYNLGLTLRFQLDAHPGPDRQLYERSYGSFYKATWIEATAGAAYFALAEMDCRKQNWEKALFHLEKALAANSQNFSAKCLQALVFQKSGNDPAAEKILKEVLAADPLDHWATYLFTRQTACDLQTRLDIAHNFSAAGLYGEAIGLLTSVYTEKRNDLATLDLGASPLCHYTLGWLFTKIGDPASAARAFARAADEDPQYCFPNRLEEIVILECAMRENPDDALAPYYLGDLYYDRKRYADAVRLWELSTSIDSSFSTVWRNLAIAYFNFERDSAKALDADEKAFSGDKNARLLFERDQLWKRVGTASDVRLAELEKHANLVEQRDDLTIEICTIYNQLNHPEKALDIFAHRKFQPWEGGEGRVLQQFVTANLLLGRQQLGSGDLDSARNHFLQCLAPPQNLSETHHFLANKADIFYWLGIVEDTLGDRRKAVDHWTASAQRKGDFQEMSVTAFSEMTLFSALSLKKLGRLDEAEDCLNELLKYAQDLEKAEAKIDYFATSLPSMRLFDDDIQKRQLTKAMFLQAQAYYGLGQLTGAENLIAKVLANDPDHQMALTLLNIDK